MKTTTKKTPEERAETLYGYCYCDETDVQCMTCHVAALIREAVEEALLTNHPCLLCGKQPMELVKSYTCSCGELEIDQRIVKFYEDTRGGFSRTGNYRSDTKCEGCGTVVLCEHHDRGECLSPAHWCEACLG